MGSRTPAHLSQRLSAQRYFEGGTRARHELDGIGSHIARLDADHLLILAVAEVGHLLRFLDPGIPHDGGSRPLLGNMDDAPESRITDLDRAGRVEVRAVHFGANPN